MLCSSAQCSSTQCLHACVVVLALVPGHYIFWVWEKLPFPDFLGRFFSRQAASGISECSVAASLVLEFPFATLYQCIVESSTVIVWWKNSRNWQFIVWWKNGRNWCFGVWTRSRVWACFPGVEVDSFSWFLWAFWFGSFFWFPWAFCFLASSFCQQSFGSFDQQRLIVVLCSSGRCQGWPCWQHCVTGGVTGTTEAEIRKQYVFEPITAQVRVAMRWHGCYLV